MTVLTVEKLDDTYRNLVELSPDGIVTLNRWGTITSVNHAFKKLTGYSADELVGKHFTKIGTVRARDIPRYLKQFSEVVRGKDISFIEFTYKKKDGKSRWAEAHVGILRKDGKLTGIQAVLRDITDRKESELTLKESQKKLQEYSDHLEALVEKKTKELKDAERMAAIGEIASMVGHDLRNPLTGIAGAIYYLKTTLNPTLDPTQMRMLDVAERNVEYSDKIINDLLDYSRKIHLETTETTSQALLRETLASIQIPKNIHVTERTQHKPVIAVDSQKMNRVFTNIISNAIDAMPEGGNLKITSRELHENLEFRFTDTGEGIPAEIKENIWKPLFTTKAKGMGLGLAICKRMVEAHGGSISVDSTVGKGTTFTIKLPLNRE
jgi:PAS domain S-box-containing protein